MDGTMEPRALPLVKKKGRFTVTPDATPHTPMILERSSSTNSAQTTPTPVQKGRFTVTPDSEAAVQIPAASEFSLSAAAIFVSAATTPAVPTKVEKKGRFVVSSAIPSGISVEPETMPHAVELPPSLPIQVTTVAQPPVEPSGQPPPLAVLGIAQLAPPPTVSSPSDLPTNSNPHSASEEKSTIMNGAARLGKPPASFDSKGLGSTVGLGKVFYFLEQMKAEVSEADRNTKLLQKEVKFLKEKNKELETKSREMEKRWKDQKAHREAAELKVKFLKKKLKELKELGNDDELAGENISDNNHESCETERSSRSNSLGDTDDLLKSMNNGYHVDSVVDTVEGSSRGTPVKGPLTRRPSNDCTAMPPASTPGRMSIESDKGHSVSTPTGGPPNPLLSSGSNHNKKLTMASNSRPPMAESHHARHKSASAVNGQGNSLHSLDDSTQNFMHPTHSRTMSGNGLGKVGISVNGIAHTSNAANGITGSQQQHQQQNMMSVQQHQQAWNQVTYPILQQQQQSQKPPIPQQQQQQPASMSQVQQINHQMVQGLQQQTGIPTHQGMHVMPQQQSQQSMQIMAQQQQPHGASNLVPQQQQQQQQVMQTLSQQQPPQAMQTLPQHQQMQPSQGLSTISQPQQQQLGMQAMGQHQGNGLQQQGFVTQQHSVSQQQQVMQQSMQQAMHHQKHSNSLQQQPLQHPPLQQQQSIPQPQQNTPTQQQQQQAQPLQQPTQSQSLQQQQQLAVQQQQQQQMPNLQQQQQQVPLANPAMVVNGNMPMNQQQQQQQFAAQFNQQQPQAGHGNGLQWS
jgi:hypothetical protein